MGCRDWNGIPCVGKEGGDSTFEALVKNIKWLFTKYRLDMLNMEHDVQVAKVLFGIVFTFTVFFSCPLLGSLALYCLPHVRV